VSEVNKDRTWRDYIKTLKKKELLKILEVVLTQEIDVLETDGNIGYHPPSPEEGTEEDLFCRHSGENLLEME
jgi:hypothetical protein